MFSRTQCLVDQEVRFTKCPFLHECWPTLLSSDERVKRRVVYKVITAVNNSLNKMAEGRRLTRSDQHSYFPGPDEEKKRISTFFECTTIHSKTIVEDCINCPWPYELEFAFTVANPTITVAESHATSPRVLSFNTTSSSCCYFYS